MSKTIQMEKTEEGTLFIQYEMANICKICGKVIHRFGRGQQQKNPHARKHIEEGKATSKKVGWHNDTRYTMHYYINEGIETIDSDTLNLIKMSIADDVTLVYAKPDIQYPNENCTRCGHDTVTPYTHSDMNHGKSWTFHVDGFRCEQCDQCHNRQGHPINR